MEIKNKIYIILGIFAIISIVLIAFLIYPIFKNIQDASSKILSYQKESALIDIEDKELNNFKKKYKEYEVNFKKIDKLFVDSKNPVDFVKFLEDTAYNLSLRPDIDFSQSAKNDIMNFSVNVKGDFSNIVRFSEKLETGPYLISIQNLSMKKLVETEDSKEKDINSQVNANFLIDVISK